MAGRASPRWANGGQRPEGCFGRRTRTQTGDVETGPHVGRWLREEGQRGAGQAEREVDAMRIQSNAHTWAPPKGTCSRQFSSVQPLTCVRLFATPWTAACQASLSITYSQSLLKLMSTESVMPSNHLILCRPLLLPPSIFPSIRIFSKESVLRIRWPKDWSFTLSSNPSNEYSKRRCSL